MEPLDAPGPFVAPTAGVPFAATLAAHGDRPALVGSHGVLSYRELARRVDDVARRLGTQRRLVLVAAANAVDPIVTYLAALACGHPVLLAPADAPAVLAGLIETYDPDVVLRRQGGQWVPQERRAGTVHDLHSDLALLLSTSGSTGSPKLVRLSAEGVQANAAAIAQYLKIRPQDRAATTLPLQYCYGLSVVNSHLLAGAGLILTDLSVLDRCFWDLFREYRGTSFAGVPHTFELLERAGFAELDLPNLRYVTQAGGRLAPETVRRYAALGERQGWDLVVMYGQTEATARMAYLPPHLARHHPEAIGVAVPGGCLSIEPVLDGDGVRHAAADASGGDPAVGELVYRGPNVMLGYACGPADLALGRTVDALRTGDLARRTQEGLFVLVGRRSRFVKVFGLRIDLERAESLLAGCGFTACCTGSDEELVVLVEGEHDERLVRAVTAREVGLPSHAVRVLPVAQLPRLPSGKPDLVAAAALAAPTGPLPDPPADPHAADVHTVLALFADLLDRPDARPQDTLVSLGGDSLSYVEVSVRLEELLGHLPAAWHTTPIEELAARQPRRRRRRCVETSVLLRALAIVLIVGTHARLFSVFGGAHVLIAVAGFNFARFQLTATSRAQRLRRQLASLARVAVPSLLWIGGVALLAGTYTPTTVALLNAVLGPPTWTEQWHFWFVEVLVYILAALAVLMAVPGVDTLERRFPFGFAVALLPAGLLVRYGVVDPGLVHTRPVFWLFALGWAAARATAWPQRALVTALVLATVPGFFDNPRREAVIAGGLLMLLWVRALPLPAWRPAWSGTAISSLASGSLYVYLTHWQVYPALTAIHPLLGVAGSLAVGLTVWQLARAATRAIAGSPRRRGSRQPLRYSGRQGRAPVVAAVERLTEAAARPNVARSQGAGGAGR